MERQPQLSLHKGDSTANIWMDAMQKQEALDNYFILLKKVLEENDLVDKPGQIYNVDESGIQRYNSGLSVDLLSLYTL